MVDDVVNVVDMPNHTDLSLSGSIVLSARVNADDAINGSVGSGYPTVGFENVIRPASKDYR